MAGDCGHNSVDLCLADLLSHVVLADENPLAVEGDRRGLGERADRGAVLQVDALIPR
jgi:hypothetical protein